jgi:hypothetical protein
MVPVYVAHGLADGRQPGTARRGGAPSADRGGARRARRGPAVRPAGGRPGTAAGGGPAAGRPRAAGLRAAGDLIGSRW